ncbi:retrovirus-related pol polyprotein from transposon TNT 1-94 [Tanacetum coccineum]
MDVKSAFLYGKIEEEVYVCQPPGFEDPDFLDREYKVEKALYRLHQAHRAWYETLSTYLLDNGFQRGKIDKTLFIKRHKEIRFTEVKTASTPMKTQKASAARMKIGGVLVPKTIGDTTTLLETDEFESVSKHSNDFTARKRDASKHRRIDAIDADDEITLVSVQNVDEEMFDVNVYMVVEVINTAKLLVDYGSSLVLLVITYINESTKPKNKGVVIQEIGESTITISSQLSSQQSHEKGKGILMELVKPMKKKDQIRRDEETALKYKLN